MNGTLLFAIFAAVCFVWFVITSIRIMDYLQKKGEKINWFLIRLLLPSYINKYRKITSEETGQAGPLYFHWIVAINGMAVFAVIAVLFKKGVLR